MQNSYEKSSGDTFEIHWIYYLAKVKWQGQFARP